MLVTQRLILYSLLILVKWTSALGPKNSKLDPADFNANITESMKNVTKPFEDGFKESIARLYKFMEEFQKKNSSNTSSPKGEIVDLEKDTSNISDKRDLSKDQSCSSPNVGVYHFNYGEQKHPADSSTLQKLLEEIQKTLNKIKKDQYLY